MTVVYDTTPRRFGHATLGRGGTPLVVVQESSGISLDDDGRLCLRSAEGDPMPGSSSLWLRVLSPDGDPVSVQLGRFEAAELAGVLTRWLATGHVAEALS